MDLIAEIGWNHMGDMDLLKRMVHAAKGAGATHAKFQTWHESRLGPGPWDTDGRRDIYKKAELSNEQFAQVRRICDAEGIRFMTSVFDARDVEAMAAVSDGEVKIPSPEVVNVPLLEEAARRFKRVFLSTGATTGDEVDAALRILRAGNVDIVLMHCVSTYPCVDERVNLPRLDHLRAKHPVIGFSDHTPDAMSAVFAIGWGVAAIEKHFTIDNGLPGRDNKFALLPDAMAQIAEAAARFEQMSVDHGLDYQSAEEDQRITYRGRWSAGGS